MNVKPKETVKNQDAIGWKDSTACMATLFQNFNKSFQSVLSDAKRTNVYFKNMKRKWYRSQSRRPAVFRKIVHVSSPLYLNTRIRTVIVTMASVELLQSFWKTSTFASLTQIVNISSNVISTNMTETPPEPETEIVNAPGVDVVLLKSQHWGMSRKMCRKNVKLKLLKRWYRYTKAHLSI